MGTRGAPKLARAENDEQNEEKCPCCGAAGLRPSWMGTLHYRGHAYGYLECPQCGSLTCSPMPTPEMLAAMYGTDFNKQLEPVENIVHPKDPKSVCAILKQQPPGRFMDFGCGAGELLTAAKELGWCAIGVEYDCEVAQSVAKRTGCAVHVRSEAAKIAPVDVLHLGDVVEHLTDVDRELPEILKLLKPGGIFISEGPLENGPTLFNVFLRTHRRLTRGLHKTEFPPYHVLSATVRGQRLMFQRFKLQERMYRVTEIAWPAQARLSLKDILRPRAVVMFTIRRISQMFSALAPNRWGNRYFFVGTTAE